MVEVESGRRTRLMLAVLYCIALAAFVSRGYHLISGDTFFDLVFGREIAERGLPTINTMTVMERGAAWSDQQWLAHLFWYGVERAGGFALVLAVRVVLFAITLGTLTRHAMRRGAPAERVLLVTLAALAVVLPHTVVRAQSLAEPIFATVLVLLLDDTQRPSRRVLLVVPLLAVWANVHGSVLLGFALLTLSQLAPWWPDRWGPRASVDTRGRFTRLILVGLGGAASLASPYGVRLGGYFAATAANADFRSKITEWGPPDPRQVPAYFLIAAAALVVFARGFRQLTSFERVVMATLALMSAWVVRHGVFFGLALMAIAPAALDAALPSTFLRFANRRINALLVGVSVTALLVTSFGAFWTLRSGLRDEWPPQALAATLAAAPETGKVFSDERHADWLLWSAPNLEGRVAFDTRMELLRAKDWELAGDVLWATRPEDLRGLDGYDAFLFDPRLHRGLESLVRQTGRWAKAWGSAGTVVYRRIS